MALINCSECTKEVSDKATSCPNCGNPINRMQSIQTITQMPKLSVNEDMLKCPKCNSTQLSSNKKGFNGKNAIIGTVLTGGMGVLAGTIGSNNVLVTCLKCGHKHQAGNYEKERNKFEAMHQEEKQLAQKIANGEQSFAGGILLFLVLSIIGVVISYKLWSNDWNFLGLIFTVATLFCVAMSVFAIKSEVSRKSKQ